MPEKEITDLFNNNTVPIPGIDDPEVKAITLTMFTLLMNQKRDEGYSYGVTTGVSRCTDSLSLVHQL